MSLFFLWYYYHYDHDLLTLLLQFSFKKELLLQLRFLFLFFEGTGNSIVFMHHCCCAIVQIRQSSCFIIINSQNKYYSHHEFKTYSDIFKTFYCPTSSLFFLENLYSLTFYSAQKFLCFVCFLRKKNKIHHDN